MNPLLLLLLGFGGFMSFAGGSESDADPTPAAPGTPIPPTPPQGGETDDGVETVELKMVVHDLAEKEVVLEISNGETVDFGTAPVENYTFAAETADGSPIGSMLLEYEGQTWLENVYPYTLSNAPLDLSEGDFEIKVTAYSDRNATGEVLAEGSVAFSTTSAAATSEDDEPSAPVVDDPEPAPAPEPEPQPEPEPAPAPEPEPAPAPAPENPGAIALTTFIWDDVRNTAVETVGDGEEIDFGTAPVGDYTLAFETADGSDIGSMLLEYEGQTWLENVYPYTLGNAPLDLSEGTFDIKATAYSGPNATGTLLGSDTISFTTTSTADAAPVNDDNGDDDAPSAPTDDDYDDNPPVVIDGSPSAPDQNGDGGVGGANGPTPINGTVQIVAGRVTTLEPQGDDIAALKVVSGLNHGNVSVNPDGTFAVVLTLSDSTADQSFTYEATHSNGSTSTHKVNLDVVNGSQQDGWATGSSHYMLATDENDAVVVEAGDNHTKIHVSGSNKALSINDIAQMEGVSINQVNGAFMEARGYGQSEDLAVDLAAGKQIWGAVAPNGSSTSTWLLMERGYTYSDIDGMINNNNGESEMHPLFVGAWGTGDKPVVREEFTLAGNSSKNLVIQDIQFKGSVRIIEAENVIFDDISVRDDGMMIWKSESVTVRNSDFVDISREASKDGGGWDAGPDRVSGLFANFSDGVLLEDNLLDHNGWSDGYDPAGSAGSPQPPSQFSHNIYVGWETSDLTVRDTISMQASSYGLQVRPGGFFEDNALIDNNIGLNNVGGDYQGAGHIGHYSLFNGNLVTSAGYKEADEKIGAISRGLIDNGKMSTLVDNIVAHLADPNNPEEQAEKYLTQTSVNGNGSRVYDDTIIYNWEGVRNGTNAITEKNTEGLDEDVLDQTTIQNFAAQLLGDPNATIADLGDFLEAQAKADGVDVVDADFILQYFREGFGIAPDVRTEAETARFVPDDLGDGVRWDNRLNWSTEDLPGTVAGDSVDLGGNTVIYNGLTTEIDEMEFGPDGELRIYGGKLTAAGGMTTEDGGGDVTITDSGQLWADGHDGADLDVDIMGGRFVNTGALTDTTLSATDGQAILATGGAIYGVSQGETLSVTGDAETGFDDDDGGVALLAFEQGSTLSLGTDGGKLGSIEEFRSGAFGDSPDVRSGIDLGDAMLEIDLSGLSAAQGEDLALLDADELIGAFDDATFSGLGSRDATVVIDYVNDSVSLKLANGSGKVAFQTVGQATDVSDGEQALWDALTAGQGVFDESTPDPALPEDEEEYLEAS